jgi:phenylpropionate dioxygenase-like ring-hydroxylating dioxygenase large terminal subunit
MTVSPAPFPFLQHWYPVSPLEDLDPDRPTPVELLGRRFVIWKPGGARSGESFRVFLDLCPHRLAPLSEGRLESASGQLMCSYHGWRFDAEGLCRRIPQASPAEPDPKQAKHLCATALPCRQEQDLLWIWPDPASADQAAATPLPLSAWVDAAAGFTWSSVVRDLPYDWQTLVENVADPAHVPFAHHGVQGRRERAMPLPIRMLSEAAERLEAQVEGKGFIEDTRITFTPPCLLEYRFSLAGGRRMGLISYCLPLGPGRSRIVAQFPRDFGRRGGLGSKPRWWDHITNRNEVLDGDAVMLHEQERELERRRVRGEAAGWRQAYRLPTSADRLVIAFRHWLDRHGPPDWEQLIGPGAAASAFPAPGSDALSAERLLDRYHQHTVHCASCRRALRRVEALQVGGVVVAAVAVAVAALLPDARRLPVGGPLLLLALAALAGAAVLRFGLEPRFRFRPYDHTRR